MSADEFNKVGYERSLGRIIVNEGSSLGRHDKTEAVFDRGEGNSSEARCSKLLELLKSGGQDVPGKRFAEQIADRSGCIVEADRAVVVAELELCLIYIISEIFLKSVKIHKITPLYSL